MSNINYEELWTLYCFFSGNVIKGLFGTIHRMCTIEYKTVADKETREMFSAINGGINCPTDVFKHDPLIRTMILNLVETYFNKIGPKLKNKSEPFTIRVFDKFHSILGSNGFPCDFMENLCYFVYVSMDELYKILMTETKSIDNEKEFDEQINNKVLAILDADKDGVLTNVLTHMTKCEKRERMEDFYTKQISLVNILAQ